MKSALKLSIVLVTVVSLLKVIVADDTFCKAFIDCTLSVDAKRKECESLISVVVSVSHGNDTASKVKDGCVSGVKNVSDALVAKQALQEAQQRDCIKSRLAEALPIVPKTRNDDCQKFVDAAKAAPKRAKRAGNSTSTANATETILAANATHPANDYAAFAKCMQEAETKSRACRPLSGCCSETTPCDYEYQLSPLHDEVIQLQYDLLKHYRTCAKSKPVKKEEKKPK